ncbi:hypothetical protein HOY80DRAFT_1051139 [Tuber brumale]|nr:hypothetical protein HOY80DRAFT_1051139 [Tuber brumale]
MQMVAGLVYCEVQGNDDPKKGSKMLVESLIKDIPAILPIQVGWYSRPETAYCDAEGSSILSMLGRMEANVSKLQVKVTMLGEDITRLQEKVTILGEGVTILGEEVTMLGEEVTILRPARDSS